MLTDHEPWHPASTIFPAMSEEDLANLTVDIQAHGQLEPIVMHHGLVLDGRSRYLACRRLGIEPKTIEFSDLSMTMREVDWVISKNLKRRHLSRSQAA